MTAYRLGPLARTLFRRLFEMPADFHLTENAFTLHLFLQRAKCLIHVVVTYGYLHCFHHLSGSYGCLPPPDQPETRCFFPYLIGKAGLYHGFCRLKRGAGIVHGPWYILPYGRILAISQVLFSEFINDRVRPATRCLTNFKHSAPETS